MKLGLIELLGPGNRDTDGKRRWQAPARPPQVRNTCFHTTNAARGREPCADSCGNEHTQLSPLCVPCRRSCYLRPPFITCISFIRDTVGLKTIKRRKLLLGAVALPLHHNVTTQRSMQYKKTCTTERVEPVRALPLLPHKPAHRQNVNAKKQIQEGGLAWALVAGPARATFSPASD